MPSRRQFLAGSGVVAAGSAIGGYAGQWPVSLDGEPMWPMPRHDPAGTGATDRPGPKSKPEVLWVTEAPEGVDPQKPPILIGDTLVASTDASVLALDCETGAQRYGRSVTCDTPPVFARADAYRGGVLAMASEEGFVGLAVSGGFALGPLTVGHERWQTTPAGEWGSIAVLANSVAADGTIYATIPNRNRIVAIDANSGRIEWEFDVGDEDRRELNRPAVRDGTVYVTSTVDHVVALDAGTGTPEWQTKIEPLDSEESLNYTTTNAPTVTEEGLVVPTSAFVDLRSLDGGSRVWRYVHDGTNAATSAAVASGTVVLTDDEQSLYGIALDSGDTLWQSDYYPDADPIVADGIVYLSYYWLAELHAFDVTTGEPLWTVEVPYASQPIVGDGRLYVSSWGGLLALGEQL
jgi:outer membrane protein assembly factor BamB